MPEGIVNLCWLIELRLAGVLEHQLHIVFLQPFIQHEAIVGENAQINTINKCKHQDWLGHDDLASDFCLANGHYPFRIVGKTMGVVVELKGAVHGIIKQYNYEKSLPFIKESITDFISSGTSLGKKYGTICRALMPTPYSLRVHADNVAKNDFPDIMFNGSSSR